VRIATRGSPLARWQAEHVAALLAARGHAVELVVVRTTGDVRTDVPIAALGGQGVFVKEVEQALLDGRADLAVHSAKDLPSTMAPELVLAAVPPRADARDALVGSTLAGLPPGAAVATGSPRRRAQLLATRPDLVLHELRGNIQTRLDRLGHDGVVAVVVAAAALDRLDLADRATERIDPAVMLPQVGQGALALQCRADDDAARAALAPLDDAATHRAVTAERAFLAALGGGCDLPVGAYATVRGDALDVTGFLARLVEPGAPGDPGAPVRWVRHAVAGAIGDPADVGRALADALLAAGGAELLAGPPVP
jgi:hydroxymethylbilane synthase